MIAVGVWVEDEDRYVETGRRGIARISEPDMVLLESVGESGRVAAYDEILEAARTLDGLEALLLVRDDAEILDRCVLERVRAALAPPDVAAVGALGARHVTSLRWWEGEVVGRVLCPDGVVGPGLARLEEAHVLEGSLIALDPAAVAHLRLADVGWHGTPGCEAELSWQLRLHVGRLVVADLPVRRHGEPIPPEDGSLVVADTLWRLRWSAA